MTDVLLSARRVGPAGKAYGLDMTEEMLDLARANAREAGAPNAVFLRGQIEAIPLPDGSVDVVISNCVINLSTDRPTVFAESFRVLRPGRRLGITDILAEDHLTPAQRTERGAQAGCIAGAPPGRVAAASGQLVAARRGARRRTRWLSSARAASKLAGSPAGTGSGTDQCTAAWRPSSSRARSQTVMTRSPSCWTSLMWQGRRRRIGRRCRRAAARAPGSTRAAGRVPAEAAGTVLARRHSAAARWERAELAVHTNSTRPAVRAAGRVSDSSTPGTSWR